MSLFTTLPRVAVFLVAFLATGSARAQDNTDGKAVLDKVSSANGLAKVREKLAEDPVGARFRVDGFTLTANKALAVAGVMLVPGADDDERAAAEKRLRNKVIAVVQEVAGASTFKEFDFEGTRAVRGEKLPHLQLQKAANDAGKTNPAADEVKIADAKFNAKGELVITGVRGANPKTAEWLDSTAKATLATNAAAIGPDQKPAAVVLDVRATDKGTEWPLSTAALQKAIIATNQPGLARVRIERAFLVPSSTKADETNPTGVNWSYALSGTVIGTQPLAKADLNKLTREVMPAAFAGAKWAPVTSGDLDQLTVADHRVPDPGPKFQKVIAGRTALDGVRLDARTEFGADGKLVLVGLQPGLDDKAGAELETAVRGVLDALAGGSDGNVLYKKLGDRGISVVKLERVKARELHAELQTWARDNLDETRLSRLFFDETGALTLLCDTPTPAIEPVVRAELKKRAATLRVPVAPTPVAEKDTASEPNVKAAAPLKRSLVAFLQEQTTDPKNKQWEAVLIERGFFNEKNEYTVRGVANSDAQKKQLAEHLAELATEPEWANYFKPTAGAAPDLEVIPMGKLVERARRVMPAYADFDGTHVTGAKYVYEKDARGATGLTLVFVMQTVGRIEKESATKLRALIAEDKNHYGRRLPKAREVRFEKDAAFMPASADVADFSTGYAATALAKDEFKKAREWLETGMLHNPTETAIWFLSAYYHHVQGDHELARRDLFRVIEIENRLGFAGENQRKRRYLAAKDLQGEKRNELEKLWLTCWKEAKDGVQPMKFAEPKK